MANWIVLKFGGTSVSSLARWQTIAAAIGEKLAGDSRVMVVCSALSKVSDQLEELVLKAPGGKFKKSLELLRSRHLALAAEMQVDPGCIAKELELLERLATGISLTGECTARLRAQLLACGELMSTRLGRQYLAQQGLEVEWVDARRLLKAREVSGQRSEQSFLSASCDYTPDPAMVGKLGPARVVITQGFIASNHQGKTVLLGRGGSDTSAAYLAAKLEARELEIWTDVAGMYTADPRHLPTARLLRRLDYREAQELATVGAKVLHPRCLGPCREYKIPIRIRCTPSPELEGTGIEQFGGPTIAAVKAVSSKRGVVLISMESLGMWQQVGVLAELFDCFRRHGLSIDLVTTSETNVTVTLDESATSVGQDVLKAVMRDLKHYCKPRLVSPCATVSLVGTRIRSILHRLAPALEVFEDEQVHMVCQSSSDLNLTFVVDEEQAERLVTRLHSLLFSGTVEDENIGPTWQQQVGGAVEPLELGRHWWEKCRAELVELARQQTPLYVYDRDTLEKRAEDLLGIKSLARVFYAIKANSNPDILRLFRQLGLGFECVSPGELELLASIFPDFSGPEVLYTPNFASRADYEAGFSAGAQVTLDNLSPLESWPELFEGKSLFLRMDPGKGGGHHRHVRTAGPLSKFGIARDQLERLIPLLDRVGASVVGLHAHSGSGIQDAENWIRVANYLAGVAELFPQVKVLDLGGGLGVSEKPGQRGLETQKLGQVLESVRTAHPRFDLWLEPGRYLVAEAGVLLTTVNQIKDKGHKAFVGVDTGMNSLIRPALYGSYHRIVNLSRWDQPKEILADVVGPICETGDVLGHDRRLPRTQPGDVLLVATAGAYGRAMASFYNLREPAQEMIFESNALSSRL